MNSLNFNFNASQCFTSSPSSSSSSQNLPALPPRPPKSLSFRYFQPPVHVKSDQSSDDENLREADFLQRHGGRHGGQDRAGKRPGACTYCKTLKVKCHYVPGQSSCIRCQQGKRECISYVRKTRRAAPTQEELQYRSNQMDREIAALVQRIDEMRTEQRIEGSLAIAYPHSSYSSSRSSDMGHDGSKDEEYPYFGYRNASSSGITLQQAQTVNPLNTGPLEHVQVVTIDQLRRYFPYENKTPTTMRNAPDIVTRGLVTPDEVMELFKIFFNIINPYFSILDPQLHTPAKTIWKNHFLFTVICALASRFHPTRPTLYSSAMEFALYESGNALTQGSKTVETCQAYLLLAVYPVPKKRWTDDRSWMLMGVAFTLATELNLANPFPGEFDERERLNRTRTWLNCYCVDASHATQFGKIPMLAMDDYMARHSRDWYRSSTLNLPIDVHLVAYVEVLRVMRDFKSKTSAFPLEGSKADHVSVSAKYYQALLELRDEWTSRFATHPQANAHMCSYRANTFRMNNAYARLIVWSFAFQKASKEGISREIAKPCIKTAKEVITIMTEELYPTQMLKYAMEAHFLFVSFAASFLMNLLTPKLCGLLLPGESTAIEALVRRLVEVLRSREVALDGRHTPYLYARFLLAFLDKYRPPQPETAPPAPQIGYFGASDLKQYQTSYGLQQYAPETYPVQSSDFGVYNDNAKGFTYQHFYGSEIDMSLTNFVQSVSSQMSGFTLTPPPGQDPHRFFTEEYHMDFALADEFRWPEVHSDFGVERVPAAVHFH